VSGTDRGLSLVTISSWSCMLSPVISVLRLNGVTSASPGRRANHPPRGRATPV